MATQPNAIPSTQALDELTERRLTYDEGFDLIERLFGAEGEMYAKVGGAEAFMRAERASWGEDEDDISDLA